MFLATVFLGINAATYLITSHPYALVGVVVSVVWVVVEGVGDAS